LDDALASRVALMLRSCKTSVFQVVEVSTSSALQRSGVVKPRYTMMGVGLTYIDKRSTESFESAGSRDLVSNPETRQWCRNFDTGLESVKRVWRVPMGPPATVTALRVVCRWHWSRDGEAVGHRGVMEARRLRVTAVAPSRTLACQVPITS
jgi:hypothetical protein